MHRRLISLLIVGLVVVAAVVGPPRAAASSAPFSDIADSPFRTDIAWLADEGITGGCVPGRFCADRVITRQELASFLVRMLDLPDTPTDFFTDDAASVHQADINRLAASGISGGCGDGRFCPRQAVSRQQMASFLVRAGHLPATSNDYFLDDERTSHAVDINRVAALGITGGCAGKRYCPTLGVTRGEMAAFLHRLATGGGSAPPPLPNPAPLPPCRYDDVPTEHAGYGDWAITQLDTISMVPSSYAPSDLVDTSAGGINGGYRLRSIVTDDLRAMTSAARRVGVTISVYSAYRSYSQQVATFNNWVARVGREAALHRSARPGHSEHQLGTTMDINNTAGAWPWMASHAWRYGWVMSYPRGETDRSCYMHEPWHYRYVGRTAAALIRASAITSREYLWRLQ